MTWYWYSARANELFIDCDNWPKAENHVRRRLMGAIEFSYLKVRDVKLYPSSTNGHMHMIIILSSPTPPLERYVWEIIFHSDIYRACCNIMRFLIDLPGEIAQDVLISQIRYHREPDATCNCERKHNKRSVMESCPAAKKLRGDKRTAAFFGKPSDSPCPWF